MRCALIGVLVLTGSLCGVEPSAGQTVVGLRGGFHVSGFWGEVGGEDWGSHTGGNFGVFVDRRISENAAFQFGGTLLTKGASSGQKGDETRMLIKYLELPALLRISLSPESRLSPHLAFGPVVALMNKCTFEDEVPEGTFSAECHQVGRNVVATDVGMVGGVGLLYRFSGGVVLTGDSFLSFGLRDLVANEWDGRNRGISFDFGIGYPIG